MVRRSWFVVDWLRTANGRDAVAVLVPGVAVGLLALLAFGAVHAWLIVPIWPRLAGGIPLALLAGVALAWAFDLAARDRGRQTAVHGLEFGVYMFGTLLPATVVDAAMRANGLRLGDTAASTAIGVALFAVSGFVVGWLVSRRRSVAVVFAVAALALMAVAGGPLPVARSARGLWLSVGVGCIASAAGAAIVTVRSFVQRRL